MAGTPVPAFFMLLFPLFQIYSEYFLDFQIDRSYIILYATFM